eukprot:9913233-Alexandrium_andersonii.AAC.1
MGLVRAAQREVHGDAGVAVREERFAEAPPGVVLGLVGLVLGHLAEDVAEDRVAGSALLVRSWNR